MAKDGYKMVIRIDPVWTTMPHSCSWNGVAGSEWQPGEKVMQMIGPCTPSRIRTTEGINVTDEFESIEERELVERLTE